MVSIRCRRLLSGLVALVAACAVATPAFASVSATYGTVATNVTVTITLYRTVKAGATVTATTDYIVKKASVTYSTAKSVKSTWTLAATQKCLTLASVAYGYYTRVTVTNGTTTGTVSQNSAIKQLKGCVTV